MRESLTRRLTGVLLALFMLVQPMLPLASAGVPASGTQPASASPSKEATWAGVLQEVDGQLPKFQEYLRGRQQLYKEMRTSIDLWAKILAEKGSQSPQPKLLAVAKEYGQRFAETLTKADDFAIRFSQDLGSVCGTNGQFRLDSSDGSHRLALLYQSQERVGLLNSLDATVEHLWDGFVVSQILPLRPDQLEKDQLRQVLETQVAVVAKIQAGRKSNAEWRAAWTQLERQENPEALKINFPNEAKLLNAATRLADDAYSALREKTDATTTAHVQMLERYRTVLLQKSEELQELTGRRDPQLLSESFLQLADPGKLDGDWRTFAERQTEIVSELVKGLAAKSAAFDKAVASAEMLVAEAGKTAESLRGKSTGHEGMDRVLQKVQADAGKDLQVASESLRKLDKTRKKFTDVLSAIGVLQGKTARLGDPRVAMYCDDLGRAYDLGEAVLLQISQHSAAIANAAGVYRVSKAAISTDSLTNARKSFYTAFDGFSKVMADDQPILERHRQLSIEVLAKYNTTASSASKQFKEVANGSGLSSYLPVLRQMSALFDKGADRINGLASPMLRAVSGAKPVITAPRLSWRGASTLGNAVTQLIEQGAYFESGAIDDAKALAKDVAVRSFSDSLRVVDLAVALHYPIRTLVTPDGMALVLGNQGPGVVIRGIGNVEHFKLTDGTALLSPPDFTLGGYAIGWSFGGAWQNFCNDVGGVAKGAEQTLSNAAQGVEQFGAQVIDTAGQVGNRLVQGAVEVGQFAGATVSNWGQSFVENPWKIAGYVGVGVGLGILAATGVGAPAALALGAAIFVGSDLGNSAVNVAQDDNMISSSTADTLHFGLNVAQAIDAGIIGGAAGLAVAPASLPVLLGKTTIDLAPVVVAGIAAGSTLSAGGEITQDSAEWEYELGWINPQQYESLTRLGEGEGLIGDGLTFSTDFVEGGTEIPKELDYLSKVSDGANVIKSGYDLATPTSLPSAVPVPSGQNQGNTSGNSSGSSVGQPGENQGNGGRGSAGRR